MNSAVKCPDELTLRGSLLFACFIALCSGSCSEHHEKGIKADTTISKTDINPEHFSADSLISVVTCLGDPSMSYALYIPPSNSDSTKFPVIIFFDPQGSGSLPLRKYRNLAREFGFVMAGSNTSKNGLPMNETARISEVLISDVKSRLPVDEMQFCLAGFSGGAKVAIISGARNSNISSFIYSGSATPLQNPTHPLSILGFAGINDMNFTDLVSFDKSLPVKNHFLIEWNGKHEWPDSTSFRNAFYWLVFNAMKEHRISLSINMIHSFQDENTSVSSDEWHAAQHYEKMIHFLKGLTSTDEYERLYHSITTKQSYEKDLHKREVLIQTEQGMKQMYMQAFQEKDLNWWKNEIHRMNSVTNPEQKLMYQRLLGFISLAGYSISSNAIQQNQFNTAEKMLAIYKEVDPLNSDQPFLEACLYTKLGQNDKALAALKEAVRLGLNDRQKILNEESLTPLQSLPEFDSVISMLK